VTLTRRRDLDQTEWVKPDIAGQPSGGLVHSIKSGHGALKLQCPLYPGGFNRSTQHLLILLEEEVCDGGDCTDMVHAAAEG